MLRLLIFATAALAFGQTVGPAFETASVRPVAPDSREPLDIRFSPGGRLTVTNLRISDLITQAYGIKQWQITGAPGWFETDRFDITAKAEGDPSREQMLQMLQALLEDRFQLRLRRETKEGAVYNLVVAKGGPKLMDAGPLKEGERAGVFMGRTGSPQQAAISYIWTGRRASMIMLASAFQDQMKRPVLDRTGIPGDFDFRVEYAADDTHSDTFAPFFTALQEQLGLRLEPAKGPVETLMIEHVDRAPREN